jgi:hypothetical protein
LFTTGYKRLTEEGWGGLIEGLIDWILDGLIGWLQGVCKNDVSAAAAAAGCLCVCESKDLDFEREQGTVQV